MSHDRKAQHGLSLFTDVGERKYLSPTERRRFLEVLTAQPCTPDRTFCEMIFWTGCRPSEALGLTTMHIDVDEALVIIRSLKKRGENKGKIYRAIPVPRDFMNRLNTVHFIRAKQLFQTGGQDQPLWTMSRTTAWKRVRKVMDLAGISGSRACARGLRHTYGVHAALSNIPETRIKKWLGHANLRTTGIYLNMATSEDRYIAKQMWDRVTQIPNQH